MDYHNYHPGMPNSAMSHGHIISGASGTSPDYHAVIQHQQQHAQHPHQLHHQPSSSTSAAMVAVGGGGRKPVRDSKRRATHSQIERRRREKINDRLVMLRTIVPACAAEVEERKRIRREEEEEARRIAAGEVTSSTSTRGGAGAGKRKRNRRRAVAAAAAAAAAATAGGGGESTTAAVKEEELGLHKLEVLTHAIDYIYELQARITELETGFKTRVKRVNDDEMGEDDVDDDETEIVDLSTPAGQEARRTLSTKQEDEQASELNQWRERGSRSSTMRPDITRTSTMSSTDDAQQTTSPNFLRNGRNGGTGNDLVGAAVAAANGMDEASPLFSATANSSTSNITALTSPMMSMSAESPIFNFFAHTKEGFASAAGSTVPSPHSMRSIGGGEQYDKQKSSSTHASSANAAPNGSSSDATWPMLPEPALQAHTQQRQPFFSHKQRSSISLALDSQDNRLHDEKDTKKREHDDAHLLLAFSTSPEVFRPTSAVRHTFMEQQEQEQDRNHQQKKKFAHQRRRLSTTAAVGQSSSSSILHRDNVGRLTSISPPTNGAGSARPSTQHQQQAHRHNGSRTGAGTSLRTQKVDGRSFIMGSAPGGAHPSSSSFSLPSPPLLALDDLEEKKLHTTTADVAVEKQRMDAEAEASMDVDETLRASE